MIRIFAGHALSLVRSPAFPIATLAAFCALVWWSNVRQIDLIYVSFGYSPSAWVYETFFPADFAENFASGTAAYTKSAFMHIYPLAYKFLGIAPENLILAVIALEISLLAWAVYLLSRTIFPHAASHIAILLVLWRRPVYQWLGGR